MLINLILATWRLTSLLNREEGPAQVFEKLRYQLGVRYDTQSQPFPTTNLAEGVLCFWCSSVWAGTALVLLAALLKIVRWRDAPFLALAASGGAILIEGLTEET